MLRAADLPAGADVLGPVPVIRRPASQDRDAAPGQRGRNHGGLESHEDTARDAVRVLVRTDRKNGTALATALRAAQAVRSARKDAGAVRLQLDAAELL